MKRHHAVDGVLARTKAASVFYCTCHAPVVDHPDAIEAHNLRMHPDKVVLVDRPERFISGYDRVGVR